MAYSTFSIDDVVTFVDPDSLGISSKPFLNIIPAINGNQFVPFLQNNESNTYPMSELSVSGVFELEAAITKLRKLLTDRKLVKIKGPGVILTDLYLMTTFNSDPMKQGVFIPGVDTGTNTSVFIKFTYSATFTRIIGDPGVAK